MPHSTTTPAPCTPPVRTATPRKPLPVLYQQAGAPVENRPPLPMRDQVSLRTGTGVEPGNSLRAACGNVPALHRPALLWTTVETEGLA